jgi:hypothetical protein
MHILVDTDLVKLSVCITRRGCYKNVLSRGTVSVLSTGKEAYNMEAYGKVIHSKIPSLVARIVGIPIYDLSFSPFKDWATKYPPIWWYSYNNVKHHRNTHFKDDNLRNTLLALGALYILIFELLRIHKGKPACEFSTNLIYKHL